MRRVLPLFALVGLALGVSRCALVSGLSDLDVDPGDAAIPQPDASVDVTIDSPGDAPKDAPIEVAPPVNDAGCTCVPIPASWTAVRFRSDRNAACPVGDLTEDVVLAPASVAATASCGCTCTTGAIDCSNPVVTYRGATLCAGGTKAQAPAITSGACTASPNNAEGADSLETTAKSAACTAQPAPFASVVTGNGRLCTKANSPCTGQTGCNDPAGGFSACVVSAGDQTCPAGYPTRTTISTSVADGRTCLNCGCTTPNVKCSLTIDAYNTNACLTKTSTLTTTLGVCGNYKADLFYKATAAVSGSCTPGNGVGSGSATAVQGRTVCCK